MSTYDQKTILLVEDEALIAAAEAKTLRQFGYHVIIAHSGEKAVRLAAENKAVSLILMDINLGKGIDGTEAARQILSGRTIPIVFLTSHSEREMVEKVRHITRYGYVIKSAGDFVLQSSIEMAFELFEAHEKTRVSETNYRRLHDTIMDAFGVVDMVGNFLEVNQSFINMLGYSMEELLQLTYLDLTPKKWHSFESDVVNEQVMVRGFSDVYEKEYIRKDGTVFPIELRTFLINNDEGRPSGMWAIVRDITARRQAEETLKESEYNLAEAQRVAKIGSWRLEVSTNAVRWSDELYRVFDVDRMEFGGLHDSFLQRVHPEDKVKVLETNKKAIELGEAFDLTYRIVTKTNQVKYIREIGYAMKGDHGNVTGLFGTAQDITEQTQAEQALHQRESCLSAIIENQPGLVWLKDTESRFLAVNRAFALSCGKQNAEELVGKTDFDVWPKELAEKYRQDDIRVMETRKHVTIEEPIHDRGETKWFETFKTPVLDGQGVVIGTTGFARDITERKCAEEEIQIHSELITTLLDTIPSPIFYKDTSGVFLGCNRAFAEFYGGTRESIIGKTVCDISPTEIAAKYAEMDQELFDHPGTQRYEWKAKNKDGKARDVIYSKATFKDSLGRVAGLVGVMLDFTDHKQVEGRIKSLLTEKELLLKEVHHRIKNNMNVIMSLLSLQSSILKDNPSAATALQDAKSRIQSMMVLYDKLYRSSDFRGISTKGYLITLINEIVGNFPNRNSVTVETQFDDLLLDLKTLSPLGLILNELLTNAMNHAFKGREDGKIFVSLSARDNHISLIVGDNGNGVPESVNITNSSGFGLQVVDMLAEQLEGIIRLERDNGSRFILEFDS
jgi:PAS domain S-box-containing protein